MQKRLSNPVIPDYTRKVKPVEDDSNWLRPFTPCIVCGKQITKGYYGRWGSGGVCSKTCNTVQEEKPPYRGEHDENNSDSATGDDDEGS